MSTANDPRTLAAKLAAESLASVGFHGTAGRAVRLSPLRELLFVKKVTRMENLSSGEGAIFPLKESQHSFWEAEVVIGRRSTKSRFTFAHELGHQAARLYLDEDIVASWSSDNVRQFCDEFAGQLLVPDELLIGALGFDADSASVNIDITVGMLERLYQRVYAPMAVVIKRLNDLAMQRRISLTNCAMVVCASRSAKRKSHFAPRILTICTPSEWFVPANKRLVSIGMINLDRAFWDNPVLDDGLAVDRLSVWVRNGWRQQEVERPIRYRIYGGSKGSTGNRVMIAVFPGP